MVLSDMPFERSRLIHSRYSLLRRPESAPIPRDEDNKNKQSKEYAAFLREQERKVGPDGFLDSNKFSHTFVVKKDKERGRSSPEKSRPTVVRLSAQYEDDQKSHEKKLKVIEDHMWQHKQEERELKRTEGDIIKNQRSVRHMLRDYENVINKKRLQEEKKLNTGLEKYTVLRRDHTHKMHEFRVILLSDISLETSFQDISNDMSHDRIRHEWTEIFQTVKLACRIFSTEMVSLLGNWLDAQMTDLSPGPEISKNRAHQNLAFQHSQKDKGRKTELTKSNLARTYKSKMSEMELKQIEVMRLNQEYENKMRQKEQEQFKLKQELADLAIALNMETQKGRTQSFESTRDKRRETTSRIAEDLNAKQTVENKIARSDGESKLAEMGKRKLSADLNLTKAHIAIKQRDEQRHLTDTQMRLEDNSNVQRQLNEAALHADMELKTKQMQQNIEAHTHRRATLQNTYMKQKKDTEEAKQQVWEGRFKRRAADQAKREHEDSLKFFQKMVTKGEEHEQNLYGKVRNAEYARQKQEQTVKRLQSQLQEMKRKNAARVRQELAERNKQEVDLEQQLLKEKAELDKVHAQREEGYVKLQNHRQGLKEDKHRLAEHEREHLRLQRISTRSDSFIE